MPEPLSPGSDENPTIIEIGGKPHYQFSDRVLPVVRGGDGPLPGDPTPPAPTPAAPPVAPPVDPANPPAPTAPPVAPPVDPAQPAEGDVSQLPEWAREAITKANNEAAKYRNERNDARTETQKQADQIKAINKALGIDTGENDPDPDALQAALAEKDTQLRVLKVETAFAKAAKAHDADEELTLAVLTRNKVLTGLDPDAADFTAQLDAAVKAAVEANPKLKATQVVAKSGSTGFNGNTGPGRSEAPVNLRDAVSAALT